MKKRAIHGYFTVEASLIMPLVLFVVVWLVNTMFFYCNRCISDGDCVIASVTEYKFDEMSEKKRQDKYMACSTNDGKVIIVNNNKSVTMSFSQDDMQFAYRRILVKKVYDPKNIVRLFRKAKIFNSKKEVTE